MTTYTLRDAAPDKIRTDVIVIGMARDGDATVVCPGGEAIATAYGRTFDPMLASLGFKAKPGDVVRIPTNDAVKADYLVVVGLGAVADLTPEAYRRAAGVAARNLRNDASVALALPTPDPAHVNAVTGGIASGLYQYLEHKSEPSPTQVADVIIICDQPKDPQLRSAFEEAQTVAQLISQTRDWVNAPPNLLTPATFAEQVATTSSETGLSVTVWDEAGLAELGAGAILGVGQGSANPPRLVKLSWEPADSQGSVALVGKGITYDSGGLSIKPAGSMKTMKMDMAGAATVASTMQAIAALELPLTVHGYLPMAENMPSGTSVRPGDVLTSLSGKTIEVQNTDAEGRLILADALAMAASDGAEVIVDIATLTGACVVALGEKLAGLFGDDEVVAELQEAAAISGELTWHMPLTPEVRKAVVDSKIADVLQHNWVRWGSSSFAAAFLEQFTGDVAWAHLDIAGPAYNEHAPWGHVPTGATGYGVSTLLEFVRARASA